jgi:hypothetical protein
MVSPKAVVLFLGMITLSLAFEELIGKPKRINPKDKKVINVAKSAVSHIGLKYRLHKIDAGEIQE